MDLSGIPCTLRDGSVLFFVRRSCSCTQNRIMKGLVSSWSNEESVFEATGSGVFIDAVLDVLSDATILSLVD